MSKQTEAVAVDRVVGATLIIARSIGDLRKAQKVISSVINTYRLYEGLTDEIKRLETLLELAEAATRANVDLDGNAKERLNLAVTTDV